MLRLILVLILVLLYLEVPPTTKTIRIDFAASLSGWHEEIFRGRVDCRIVVEEGTIPQIKAVAIMIGDDNPGENNQVRSD